MKPVTLNKDQNTGFFKAMGTTRTQIWSVLWLEQSDTGRVISYPTSYMKYKHRVHGLFCAVRNERDESLATSW